MSRMWNHHDDLEYFGIRFYICIPGESVFIFDSAVIGSGNSLCHSIILSETKIAKME